jgi:hypothetical protein
VVVGVVAETVVLSSISSFVDTWLSQALKDAAKIAANNTFFIVVNLKILFLKNILIVILICRIY